MEGLGLAGRLLVAGARRRPPLSGGQRREPRRLRRRRRASSSGSRTSARFRRPRPCLADGKLYVGTENGKFFILEPSATGAKVLDEDQLGTEQQPEIDHRLGRRLRRPHLPRHRLEPLLHRQEACDAEPAPPNITTAQLPHRRRDENLHVQVVPDRSHPQARRERAASARACSTRAAIFSRRDGGDVGARQAQRHGRQAGSSRPRPTSACRPGEVRQTVGRAAGAARVRVIPPLPWDENFDAMELNTFPQHWTNTGMKFIVRDVEGQARCW